MTMTASPIQSSVSVDASPWWRYGHVWLLIGLLAFAIAACVGLAYAALKIGQTDTVYADPRQPQDGSALKVTRPNMLPAQEASHHATTGGIGAPSLVKPENKSGAGGAYAPVDD